ncbi:MAG TPA: hypothetical protein VFH73_26115 [Polyangia bacterium]|jgi:hypothetical protein|nr:hypothetical protein [Polyangia bacterium]
MRPAPTDGDRMEKVPSLLSMLPRRNLRRALFLFIALLGVLAIKYSGGSSVGSIFNTVAPAQTPAPGTMRLQVVPPEKR